MAKKNAFQELVRAFRRQKIDLPLLLGNDAKNFFLKSFRNEGFTDNSLTKWPKRKRPNKSDRREAAAAAKKNRKPRRRGLLIDSGNLRKSIKVKSRSFKRIRVGSYGIPYANIHNTGGKGKAFGKHDFKMPQRQFIGKSAVLRKKLSNRISKQIASILGKSR